MGNSKIRKPHEVQSAIKEYLEKKPSLKDMDGDNCFVISFKHFDRNQSQGFYEWQETGMLAQAMDVLSSYCSRPLLEQCDPKKFVIYGSFPPKSAYRHPSYVPEDAKWGRIHVNGVHVIAGHIFKNIFYVVFLDPDHQFYQTDIQDRNK